MKRVLLKLGALALLTGAALVATPTQAQAYTVVRFGTPPPPPPRYIPPPWARPYRTAVWIAPGYQLVGGRYVWTSGYYGYPPRPGMRYMPAHYSRGYWYPGRWR